jgi:hypothetical protein
MVVTQDKENIKDNKTENKDKFYVNQSLVGQQWSLGSLKASNLGPST